MKIGDLVYHLPTKSYGVIIGELNQSSLSAYNSKVVFYKIFWNRFFYVSKFGENIVKENYISPNYFIENSLEKIEKENVSQQENEALFRISKKAS